VENQGLRRNLRRRAGSEPSRAATTNNPIIVAGARRPPPGAIPPLTPITPPPWVATAPVDQDTAEARSDALRRELIAIAALILGVFLACTIRCRESRCCALARRPTCARTSGGSARVCHATHRAVRLAGRGAAAGRADRVRAARSSVVSALRAEHSWLAFLIGGAVLVPIAFGLAIATEPQQHPLAGLWGSFVAFYLCRSPAHSARGWCGCCW
jgi:hypothetical protein